MTIDTLGEYGIARMEDVEVRGFLSSQHVGVLGLPAEGAPYLCPMSFWFDGTDRVYFPYVVGARSHKAALSDEAAIARLLVYRAETAFNWRSVLLTGPIDEVPEDERDAVEAELDVAWRPALFERAGESETTALYALRIDEQSGIKHLGLPPGFDPDAEAR